MSDQFRLLTRDELKDLYAARLVRDFPKAELKSLSMMEKLWRQGYYQPYALFRDGELLAYALYWSAGEGHAYVMLDYFAVVPALRNQGVGSALFRDMMDRFCVDSRGVFGEVEIPNTGDEAVDSLRRRRIGFYLRAGVRPMGYTTKIFSVPFQVMAYGPHISDEDLMATHRAIYRTGVTGSRYDKNIFIPEGSQ